MALIECWECSAQVSDLAPACPHCGASRKESNSNDQGGEPDSTKKTALDLSQRSFAEEQPKEMGRAIQGVLPKRHKKKADSDQHASVEKKIVLEQKGEGSSGILWLALLGVVLCLFVLIDLVSVPPESTRLSAEQGYPRPQDDAESVSRLRLKAEQGDPVALNNLGVLLLKEDSSAQDVSEALHLFESAISIGLPNRHRAVGPAATSLGHAYMTGKYSGVPRNTQEALRWNLLGADFGHTNAFSNLAMMYAGGIGVERDYSTMLGYLVRSVETYTENSSFILEKPDEWLEYVRGAPPAFWEARELYWRAIRSGDTDALNRLRGLNERLVGAEPPPVSGGASRTVLNKVSVRVEVAEPSQIEVQLIPFDRDAVFDSMARAFGQPEPLIPQELVDLKASLGLLNRAWDESFLRWEFIRDTLVVLSEVMETMDRGSGAYVVLFREFNDWDSQLIAAEEEQEYAFGRYEAALEKPLALEKKYTAALDAWGDNAFRGVASTFSRKHAASGLDWVFDTTTASGLAHEDLELKDGTYWVHARHQQDYAELYWNYRISVAGGQSITLTLDSSNVVVPN